jgi:hypothetical protein
MHRNLILLSLALLVMGLDIAERLARRERALARSAS